MRFYLVTLLLAWAGLLPAESEHERRLIEAADVFQEVMNTPDKTIPQELLDRAECVVIVPGLKRGAFIVGGKYGRGFMVCRTGNVGWSASCATTRRAHCSRPASLRESVRRSSSTSVASRTTGAPR